MVNSTFEKEYASISTDLMEYVASMKNEIEDYAARNNAQQWVIDKNEKKLNKLFEIKNRFDILFQNMLLSRDSTFNTGKSFGYKEAKKDFDKILNPYNRDVDKEKFREVSKNNAMLKWSELF